MMFKKILSLALLIFLFSCKKTKKETPLIIENSTKTKTEYATGFEIEKHQTYSLIHLKNPWPKSDKSFTYLLVNKGTKTPKNIIYDQKITVPINKIVVTSTTHIPALESLDVLDKLVGFPNTKYISSKKTRSLIDNGKIKELGKDQHLNVEVLIDLEPDVVIGFGVNGSNKAYNSIDKSGIPVFYNSEWIEQHALGRAEWILFFGAIFGKEKRASTIFNEIKTEYLTAKKLVENISEKPTVLSGAPFKDIWYVPYGNSWASQFINDAGGNYLWKNTKGSGSINLNIETVLEKAQHADFWVASSTFETKDALLKSNSHYSQFEVFNKNNIYFSNKKGATNGLLFFELGPNRPDLLLKDLIKIFHPTLLPNHKLYFYNKLY